MTIEMFDDERQEETPTVFETMWDYAMTFLKCVGAFAVACFIAGYIIYKQPSSVVTCQPTKAVLAKGIFK